MAVSGGIDCDLEVEKQPRRVLHLVDDHWSRMLAKEAFWFLFGLLSFRRKIQRNKLMIGKEPSKRGSFPRLSRSGEHDHEGVSARSGLSEVQYREESVYAKYAFQLYILHAAITIL